MSQIQENLGDLFFALCVNFLLYCALIIVFYMLITFYLEEETSHTEQGYTKISTNEDGQEYKDDEDDEEDDVEDDEDDNENEKKISDKESESGLELVERKKPIKLIPPLIDLQTPSHDSPYTIVSGRKFLSSSSSSSSELPSSSQGVAVDSTTSSVNVASVVTSIGTSDSDSPAPVTTSSAADSSTTATTSTSTTQPSSQRTVQTMIKKVLFYAIGLTTTFSIWGIVQERMLTQPYDGVYFKYSYGLIFLNRLGGLLLSLSLMSYFRVTWVYSPLWEYSFPSVANMLSSWCQYEALKYVSFPTQTLSKAFKVVPVM